ncbi:SDR family NAD(P)-dependent oxidoreductase [Microbacterium sp. RD1]|uniref:SDR family NAD(P)-dependent oxidoreductase n=1 Tax=Microbacterium sp. RD1 TaxID=3457313 RepID=UPI003FA60345
MRILITGAASGIGRATALAAASQGAHLLLVDRDADGLRAAVAEAQAAGGRAYAATADLTDPEACDRAVAEAGRLLGGLDGLVSNAGAIRAAALRDLSVEGFDTQFALNTRPTWLLGRAAHGMLAVAGGAIVATASMSGSHPTPPLGGYSPSKAALIMLVKQMALEWGPDGIRCNTVSPGPTLTAQTAGAFGVDPDPGQRRARAERAAHIPTRRLGAPEDVAAAILFLLSSAARQITGVDLAVDGGMSLALMPATGSGAGHRAQGD